MVHPRACCALIPRARGGNEDKPPVSGARFGGDPTKFGNLRDSNNAKHLTCRTLLRFPKFLTAFFAA